MAKKFGCRKSLEEPLHLLKVLSRISNAFEQFKKGHSELDEKLANKLLNKNKSNEEKVAKMRIENLESL